MILRRHLGIILSALLILSACSPAPQDCRQKKVFCVGLVTALGTLKEDINQQAWSGVQDAQAQGGVDRIDAIETVDTRDRAKNIESLADAGYDVIITVGASMSQDTEDAARKYPQIKFIGVEQEHDVKYPNLTSLVFQEDRGGYLAGALAALVTQTHHISGVCEASFIDSMRRYCEGFRAGAYHIDRTVKVSLFYHPDSPDNLFNDPTWGSATAAQSVQNGTDILFAAGGRTADAALESAAAQGAYVIGSETDVYARLPEIHAKLLSSAYNDIRSGVRDLIRLAVKGQIPAGDYFGQTGLAPFHDLENQVTPDMLKQLNQILIGLDNGSILTEIPYKQP